MSDSHPSTSSASQPRQYPGLLTVVIYSLAMLLLFWAGTKILFSSQPALTDEETVRSAQRAEIKEKYQKVVDEELNRYAWKNQEAGQLQIPVEEAMKLTVASLAKNNEIRAAYPVDPLAAPAPAPAAPAEATPAAPAPAAEGAEPETPVEVPSPAADSTEPPAPAEPTGEAAN